MRTILLTTDDVVQATCGWKFASDGLYPAIGSGVLIGSDGHAVGQDMYAEVAPKRWVRASELPEGLMSEERRRGTLYAGLVYGGKFISRLNVNKAADRLIAAKIGLKKQVECAADSTVHGFKQKVMKLLRIHSAWKHQRKELLSRVAKLKNDISELQKSDEDVKQEAAKQEEVKHEAKTEPEEEPFDTAAFEELRAKWALDLKSAWERGVRENLKSYVFQGQRLFLYAVKLLDRFLKPGLTVETYLVLDEKLVPLKAVFNTSFVEQGAKTDVTVEPVDQRAYWLSADEAMKIVNRFNRGDFYE